MSIVISDTLNILYVRNMVDDNRKSIFNPDFSFNRDLVHRTNNISSLPALDCHKDTY